MTDQVSTLIAEYLQLRTLRAERDKLYKADILKFDNALERYENEFLRVMTERGETQIKTEAGTAFKSPQIRVGMEDRASFINYLAIELSGLSVEAIQSSDVWSFFTNAVAKEPVKAYVDAHGAPPPGVKFEQFVAVNVRKA